jgi:hypothetical protein
MLLVKASVDSMVASIGGGKCESCLAVVLDIFVSFGEGTERGDFLDLGIRADSHLGWSPYFYTVMTIEYS